jgi:DNA repair exonuclease SbcCD ATPase subunit
VVNYREKLNNRQGQLAQVNKNIAHYSNGLSIFQEQKKDLEQAQWIIQTVASDTQSMLKFHIENLVSLALSSVFDDAYDFEIDMQLRRNQTECDLFFVRDGERINPLTASGGGAVDVASFALRIALWSLQPKRTRPIFILDEPARNVSAVYQDKCSAMMKAVADKLGLQIIAVTHSEALTEAADKVIKIGIKKGVSQVC